MRILSVCVIFGLMAIASAVDVDISSHMKRVEKVETTQCPQQQQQQNPCQSNFVSQQQAALPEPDEVVQPIDDWIKEFKRRTGGGSLYETARSTVRPLIDRLKRTQQRAQEEINRSNREILDRVEESTVNHVYNLLRATRSKQEKTSKDEEKKAQIAEIKDEIAQRQEMLKNAAAEAGKVGQQNTASGLVGVAAKEEKKLEQEVKKELEKKF